MLTATGSIETICRLSTVCEEAGLRQVSNGGRFVSKTEFQGPYAPVSLSGAHSDISAAAIINGLALLPPPISASLPPTPFPPTQCHELTLSFSIE
jgi:hypothetical protein